MACQSTAYFRMTWMLLSVLGASVAQDEEARALLGVSKVGGIASAVVSVVFEPTNLPVPPLAIPIHSQLDKTTTIRQTFSCCLYIVLS
jgi:hypothetical protein